MANQYSKQFKKHWCEILHFIAMGVDLEMAATRPREQV